MLPYISECENRQGIALSEKFPHCLREIIQGFYYTPLKKVRDVTLVKHVAPVLGEHCTSLTTLKLFFFFF